MRIWKTIQVLSLIVAIAAFIYAVGLQMQWFWTAPLLPQPEAGRVQRFLINGKTVYVTIRDYHILNTAFILSFIGVMVAGLVTLYKAAPMDKRNRGRSENDQPSE